MVRTVDTNDVDDPSAMALTEFSFDAPTVSGSVRNCIIYSNKWTANLSGAVVEKNKNRYLIGLVKPDVEAKSVSRFDDRNSSKSVKYAEICSRLHKIIVFYVPKIMRKMGEGSGCEIFFQ